jgi:hypothetical protein
MSTVTDRLELYAAILTLLEKKRAQTRDGNLGAAIERVILEGQFREMEQEILEGSGAFDPWPARRAN